MEQLERIHDGEVMLQEVLHECADRELYQECYELADFLLAMEICAEGDYAETDFSLKDLAEQKIASFDYEKFVLDAARKYADNHPKLYLQVLEQCKAGGQAKEGKEIGKEAVSRIGTDRQVRSQAESVR